jgi:hypothetical protein
MQQPPLTVIQMREDRRELRRQCPSRILLCRPNHISIPHYMKLQVIYLHSLNSRHWA